MNPRKHKLEQETQPPVLLRRMEPRDAVANLKLMPALDARLKALVGGLEASHRSGSAHPNAVA